MQYGRADGLLSKLRGAMTLQMADLANDGELVARFAAEQDAIAFATLVRRHGPMVMGVARRTLQNRDDADDVFQAAFLVLARKAGNLRHANTVGNWLYGVARRLAQSVRASRARRQDHEKRAGRRARTTSASSDPAADLSFNEVRQVLDEELARLPEKYRTPLVICCLEGLTRDEAARQLGWPVSLVKSRLERARVLLHNRLVRRGLTLSSVLSAGILAEGDSSAASMLMQSTVQAAVQLRMTGKVTAVEAGIVALAKEGSRAFLTSRRVIAALLLVAGLPAGTAWLLFLRTAPDAFLAADADATEMASSSGRVDSQGDPLPDGALYRFGSVRFRPGEWITKAVVSPDGKWLATMGSTGIVALDLSTGRPVYRITHLTFDHHPAVVFSRDSNFLVALNARIEPKELTAIAVDRSVCKWDLRTGKQVSKVLLRDDPTVAKTVKTWTSSFGPDGKDLVIITDNGHVYLYDSASGKRRWTKEMGPTGWVPLDAYSYPIALSPDGKLVAIGKDYGPVGWNVRIGKDFDPGEVCLFETANGAEVQKIAHHGELYNVCFSPDGSKLALGRSHIRLYDVKTGQESAECRSREADGTGNGRGESSIVFAPDGKSLFKAAAYSNVERWDLTKGVAGPPLDGKLNWLNTLVVSPDGRTLLAITHQSRACAYMHRWELPSGKAFPPGPGYTGPVHSHLSHDGKLVAVGDAAGKLELFDAQTGRRVRSLQTTGNAVTLVRWSPDDKLLAVLQGKVSLWDPATGREGRVLITRSSPRASTKSYGEDAIAFSPDGRYLVTTGQGLQEWDVANGALRWSSQTRYMPTFSADGKTIAVIDSLRHLAIVDASTGAITQKPDEHSDVGPVTAIAFSPDGSWLATSHEDGYSSDGYLTVEFIYVRDPKTGAVIRSIKRPLGTWCTAVDVSPDSKRLLAGGSDGSVCVLDVSTDKELLRRYGHGSGVVDVTFGPGPKTALSSSNDGTALLWDLSPTH